MGAVVEMKRYEFERAVAVLSKGMGNKALRNKLYDLVWEMKREEEGLLAL